MNLVALGGDAEFLRADPGQRPDVAALQLVVAHHGFLRLHHFLLAEGNLHAQNFGAVKKSLGVLFKAKNRRALRRFVSPHAFKSAAAVMQGVAQHMNLGVAPFDHLAVHPDLAVTVVQGRGYWGHGANPSWSWLITGRLQRVTRLKSPRRDFTGLAVLPCRGWQRPARTLLQPGA